jgi:hypothetical protein
MLAAAAAMPAGAWAEGLEGKWSLSVSAGTELDLAGDVHTAGSGRVLNLPTTVEARSYGDIYDRSFRGTLGLAYGVAPQVEIFGRASYYKMTSNNVRVGNVAGLDLFGEWSEYKEWGFEAGPRFYFGGEASFKPYVALVAGLRSLSENPATFRVPAAGVTLRDVAFWDKSTVGVFGADLGFTYDVGSNVALGLETGPRYQSQPKRLNGLAGTGLEPINDTGSRWSMPILATLSLRF